MSAGVSFLTISHLRYKGFLYGASIWLALITISSSGICKFWEAKEEEIRTEFVPGNQEFSRSAILDGTWAAATGEGQGDRAADPLVIAGWPDVDGRLRSNSPAVDHGDATDAPGDDLSGVPRPQGSAWDMGAYER